MHTPELHQRPQLLKLASALLETKIAVSDKETPITSERGREDVGVEFVADGP